LSTWKDTSVSGLWTPGGGRPPPDRPPGDDSSGDEAAATAEEIEALRAVHAKLVATPVEDVIANHALGIWQLALVHLGVITPPDADGRPPGPNLAAAGLAIDALAALLDGLGERLGAHEPVLRDALTQAQMLFVEVSDGRTDPPDPPDLPEPPV
jgi:hypothetical protein